MLIVAGGIYQLTLQSNVSINTDGRKTIYLNPEEMELVLSEMRLFLISVQKITKGISENDMKLVAEYARKAGRAAQGDVPVTLMDKLPMQFKKSGFDTHTKFDQLALDSEDLGDSNHALSQLSNLMTNCISCHATYRIDISNR